MGILPPKLTHEEQALLNKFALLKKKKKTPVTTKNTTEAKSLIKSQKKENTTESTPTKVSDPKDAKEIAKKLIASGQVKINKTNDIRSFKRAQPWQGRKPKSTSLPESPVSTQEQTRKIENIRRDSYNNFVSSTPAGVTSPVDHKKNETDQNKDGRFRFDKRRQANLFVQGYGLTKQVLDDSFPQFGPIVNLYMDQDKGHGYVTYANRESAEKAIAELHGAMVNGITIRVVHARKRPYDDNRYTWRAKGPRLGSSDHNERPVFNRGRSENLDAPPHETNIDFSPPKREMREKRKLVNYEEDGFDF